MTADATGQQATITFPACEVCGREAKHGVQDLFEIETAGGFRKYVAGEQHWFCDEHQREPDIILSREW